MEGGSQRERWNLSPMMSWNHSFIFISTKVQTRSNHPIKSREHVYNILLWNMLLASACRPYLSDARVKDLKLATCNAHWHTCIICMHPCFVCTLTSRDMYCMCAELVQVSCRKILLWSTFIQMSRSCSEKINLTKSCERREETFCLTCMSCGVRCMQLSSRWPDPAEYQLTDHIVFNCSCVHAHRKRRTQCLLVFKNVSLLYAFTLYIVVLWGKKCSKQNYRDWTPDPRLVHVLVFSNFFSRMIQQYFVKVWRCIGTSS
jgi:hypothetical protein